LQYASNDWVFSLDADERITAELAAEINALDLSGKSNYDSYAVKRKNMIGSRWVKCCRWYPDYLVRLYRPDKTRFLEETTCFCSCGKNEKIVFRHPALSL